MRMRAGYRACGGTEIFATGAPASWRASWNGAVRLIMSLGLGRHTASSMHNLVCVSE